MMITFPLHSGHLPPACHSYRYDHHTRLLPYVLNAIADEAEVSGVIYTYHAVL